MNIILKIRQKALVPVIIAAILLLCTGCRFATIVRISDGKILSNEKNSEEAQYLVNEDAFDSDKYVESIWESKALPFYNENAKDVNEVLTAISSDLMAAGEKFGYARATGADTFNFIVKSRAKVLNVNQESRIGVLVVDFEPFDAKEDAKILIGPVFKGDALRNTLPFIKFSDFKSQNTYAEISKAIHKVVERDVISKLDLTTIKDKTIDFTGSFTYSKSTTELLIMPSMINVEG